MNLLMNLQMVREMIKMGTTKFTNSSLVVYTKLSPNCNKPRNHSIDMITIHTMAGNCSIETCGEIFYPTSRGASSNYGIGTDGRVAMYVEECNRSWCSSNSTNDNRAITIEVASCKNAEPYPCSDTALKSLIELCYDICKRNGIKKLLWKADKSLVGQVGKQNMSVHRWFANKSCPGDYLYNLHGFIADEVNKKLGTYTTPQATCVPGYASNPNKLPVVTPDHPTPHMTTTATSSVSSTSETTKKLVGKTNEEKIWNYLKGKGLNNFAISGLMGNLYAESGLIPNNLQNSFESRLGYTDESYTKAVDDGSYAKFITDSAGYGLAQWTYSSRKSNLLKMAQSQHVSIGDLGLQLDFLWDELQKSYASLLTALKNATTVKGASDLVLTKFEKPAIQNEKVKATRCTYAQKYYTKYAVQTTKSNVPYTIKVVASELNVRKSAGLSYAVTTTLKKNEVYTIVEEKQVTNSDQSKATWGKLKSGVGWINVGSAYVKKL